MEDLTRVPSLLVDPKTSSEAFDALNHAHRQLVAAEVAELVAITHAADLWQIDPTAVGEGIEALMRPGHDGTPEVGEFLGLEIGGLLGISPQSAICRIGDALDLRHRHPLLWKAIPAGKIRVWQATKICAACSHLSSEAALKVDRAMSTGVGKLPFPRLMKALPGQIVAADTELARHRAEARRQARHVRVSRIEDGHVSFWGLVNPVDGIMFDHVLSQLAKTLPTKPEVFAGADLDRRRAAAFGMLVRDAYRRIHDIPTDTPTRQGAGHTDRPIHTLVVHISAADPALSAIDRGPATGVARVEDWGPILTNQLPRFLAGSKVIIRPVIDPTQMAPADAYETPTRMRFAVEQRNPVDVFPWGTRKASRCDMDHTIPYVDGLPGQTRLDNLGPLSRKTHRAKTHGRWKLEQPTSGVFRWTSPHGYRYEVTPSGTTQILIPAPQPCDVSAGRA